MIVKRARRRPREGRLGLPELDDLIVLPFLLDDELHLSDGRADFARHYDTEGRPIAGSLDEQLAVYLRLRSDRANHLASPTFYRAGTPLWVSTVYIGINLAVFREGPPMVWETMVFSGTGDDEGCWRYATRAAAVQGHRLVTQTIREAQRVRRFKQRVTAPRRLVLQGAS